ncbi:MAG: hypothetical protein HY298_14590 [Verrucomicrobia bacterium]|nr:hypothetical protein [Verrucomicrobiota bacterium]
MNISKIPRTSFVKSLPGFVSAAALLLALTTPAAWAHWPNTNATKWVQYPDPTDRGIDVLASPVPGAQSIALADDFLCKQTGPITDIHIWASWLGDKPATNAVITLSFWSDVPATNSPTGGLVPSHPGTRLWTQTFGPGQYQVKAWQSAHELFWNPDQGIMGNDTIMWQYNFYPDPAGAFRQQGTPTAPVVYWLSVSAGPTGIPAFGWKTSTNHWNDDAVFGHPDTGGNVSDWKELRDPNSPANPISLDLSFVLTTPQVITNPPPQPPVKWVQYPDQSPEGLDVQDTFPNILADDFLCKSAGQITNIQVWGSWLDDNVDPNTRFTLGIWSDVPAGASTAGANITYSHPGQLLWTATFSAGDYTFGVYSTGPEQFYDPNPTPPFLGPDNQIWLYNFTPKLPFCQRGSTNQPVVYWLSVIARTTSGHQFGWKTSTNHWNDDAVYGHVTAAGGPVNDWKDLHDPRSGISLDLSFRLQNGPPIDCDPQHKPKWVQWPDPSTNGIDVRATYPKVLADDFPCRVRGPIRGITVWGSWLNDKVDPNTIFQLSLWDDVPAVTNATGVTPSHPGQLRCSSLFYPPQSTSAAASFLRYKYRLDVDNVREQFYDPDIPPPGGIIGNDTQIWRYDFYPRQKCWFQDGSPFNGRKIFWLSVCAFTDTNQFMFGWKTSTNHFQDDGVYGHLGPNNNALGDWKDLHDPNPPGNSLDLSFAIRTFPVVGLNKDLRNVTQQTADGLQIVVAGIHEVTWHYDDNASGTPWPNFQSGDAGGNTLLQWSGKLVTNGQVSHVGFEMAGTPPDPQIVSMSWLQGNVVIGKPIQVNPHVLANSGMLTFANDLFPGTLMLNQGHVEWFMDPPGLDMMMPGVNRNPMGSAPLQFDMPYLMPGGAMMVPIPPAPMGARYSFFDVFVDLAPGARPSGIGPAGVASATEDFLLMALDAEVQPIIEDIQLSGTDATVTWTSVPGRTYRLQSNSSVNGAVWTDLGDVAATDPDTSMTVPIGGDQTYYRVALLPE